MKAFEEFVKKTSLADTTLRQYKGILNRILEPYNINAVEVSLKDLKDILERDYSEIINYVDDIPNVSTKKNYYSFIVKFMRTMFPKSRYYTKYDNKLKHFQSEIDKRYENGKLTDRQKQRWKKWDEIIKIRDERKERIDKLEKEFKEGNLNKVEYATELLDFIILGLYTYQNPRRNEDYTGMKWMKTLKENENLEPNTNYYYAGNEDVPAHFVFQNFKTKKNYGEPQRIKINEKLNEYILKFLDLFPKKPEYALNQILEDKGLRTDQIIKSLKRSSGQTSSDFRRSFLTHMLGPTLEIEKKKKELAYNMGHSRSQMKYVKDI